MMSERDKKVVLKIIGATVAVFLIVLIGTPYIQQIISIIFPPDGPEDQLDHIIETINVNTVTHLPYPNIPQPLDTKDILPDIKSEYPPQV
jgi:hypothetical protein